MTTSNQTSKGAASAPPPKSKKQKSREYYLKNKAAKQEKTRPSKPYDPNYYQAHKAAQTAATRRLRAKRRAERQPVEPKPTQQVTLPNSDLGRAITAFLNAKAGLAKRTQDFYRSALTSFVTHTGDKWPIEADDIDSFLAELRATGSQPATVHAYFRVIKTLCFWLVKRKKISRDDNPIEMAERPRLPKLLPRAPELDQIQKLVTYLEGRAHESWKGLRNIALVSLLIDTGLRINEACGLDLEDLDLEKCTVFLSETKTKFDGISVFSPVVADYLADYLAARAALPLPAELSQVVFISDGHGDWRRLTDNGVRDFIERACRAAGIAYITPHKFRHFAAISSLQNGANLIDVQHQLRHRDIRMTSRYLICADKGRPARHAGYSPFAKLGGGNE